MTEPRTYHVDPPKAAHHGSELEIQTLFRGRAKTYCPRVKLVAVPNGTHIKSHAGRAKAKREGLSAGFPDMIALAPGMTAYLEFKARKGQLSEHQKTWLQRLTDFNFPVGVFRHPDTALRFLHAQGFPFMTEPPR
jgi:hypothetical protein